MEPHDFGFMLWTDFTFPTISARSIADAVRLPLLEPTWMPICVFRLFFTAYSVSARHSCSVRVSGFFAIGVQAQLHGAHRHGRMHVIRRAYHGYVHFAGHLFQHLAPIGVNLGLREGFAHFDVPGGVDFRHGNGGGVGHAVHAGQIAPGAATAAKIDETQVFARRLAAGGRFPANVGEGYGACAGRG